jgi:hypothetical protein
VADRHHRPFKAWVGGYRDHRRPARPFFKELADGDPMFGGWIRAGSRRHYSAVPAAVTMPPDETELGTWIDENPVFGSREGRKKRVGHWLKAITPEQSPLRVDFWLSFQPEKWWSAHRMGVTIFSGAGPSSPLDDNTGPQSLAALLRRVVVVTGSAWDCDWAGVMPGRYPFENDPIRKRGPLKYESGWIGISRRRSCGPYRSAAGCRCRYTAWWSNAAGGHGGREIQCSESQAPGRSAAHPGGSRPAQ